MELKEKMANFSLYKLLFVGDLWCGSNAKSMMDGFRDLGLQVATVDTTFVSRPSRLGIPWIYKNLKAGNRLPHSLDSVERRIFKAVNDFKPEVLFVFKGIHLRQEFLLSLPIKTKIHYSPDDVSNSENLTKDYLNHEVFWDAVVTTKSFNVSELTNRGVQKVIHVWSAYDPRLHIRVHNHARQFDIGFIGNRRLDRIQTLAHVASRYGSKFYLAGPGWWKECKDFYLKTGSFPGSPKYGPNFSQKISQINLNLVLLNSDNRDLHTCRSFEVPASGGLVLGERTSEHELLFEDMKDGLLFTGVDELFDKADYVLSNPSFGESLRYAGYSRITSAPNKYSDRAKQILEQLS